MSLSRCCPLAACALLLTLPGAASGDAFRDAAERFEQGDLAGARAEWIGQLAEKPSAALYYNLGRVDQELSAGPQAVLWYRRALAGAPDDPWASDNLERLRRDLGLPRPDQREPMALLHAALPWSTWVAAAALWLTLAVRWRTGRPRGWVLAAAAGVVASGYLGAQIGVRLVPVEAVLMSECQTDETSLPAGSEVWLSRSTPGRLWTAGSRFDCQPQSVIAVNSDQLPPAPTALDSPLAEPVAMEPVADLEGAKPDLDLLEES